MVITKTLFNDYYPKESMQGTYVIGVMGLNSTSYTLSVVLNNEKLIDITPGK
jgi:hypothetical protein